MSVPTRSMVLASLATLGLLLAAPPREARAQMPRLGVALTPVPQGARIYSIEPGSAAAEKTHLRVGDIITSVNGYPIHHVRHLRWVIAHSRNLRLNVRYWARRHYSDGTIRFVLQRVTVRLQPIYGAPGTGEDEDMEEPPGPVEEPDADPES